MQADALLKHFLPNSYEECQPVAPDTLLPPQNDGNGCDTGKKYMADDENSCSTDDSSAASLATNDRKMVFEISKLQQFKKKLNLKNIKLGVPALQPSVACAEEARNESSGDSHGNIFSRIGDVKPLGSSDYQANPPPDDNPTNPTPQEIINVSGSDQESLGVASAEDDEPIDVSDDEVISVRDDSSDNDTIDEAILSEHDSNVIEDVYGFTYRNGSYTCDHCGSFFSDAGYARTHHENMHAEEASNVHRCHRCPAVFPSAFELDDHQRVHLRQDEERRMKARSAQKVKLSTEKYTCGRCKKSFCDKPSFYKHNVKKKCKKVTRYNYGLHPAKRHAIPDKTSPDMPKRRLKCDNCHLDFSAQNALTAHVRFCTGFIKNIDHKQSLYKTDDHGSGALSKKQYCCAKCQQHFDSLLELCNHQPEHATEDISYKFTCDVCGEMYGYVQPLASHRRNCEPKPVLNSDKVKKKLKHSAAVYEKTVAHTKDVTCARNAKDKKHVKDSTAEKQVKSVNNVIKDQLTAMPTNLKNAILAFRCQFCGDRFSEKHDLKDHRRLYCVKYKKHQVKSDDMKSIKLQRRRFSTDHIAQLTAAGLSTHIRHRNPSHNNVRQKKHSIADSNAPQYNLQNTTDKGKQAVKEEFCMPTLSPQTEEKAKNIKTTQSSKYSTDLNVAPNLTKEKLEYSKTSDGFMSIKVHSKSEKNMVVNQSTHKHPKYNSATESISEAKTCNIPDEGMNHKLGGESIDKAKYVCMSKADKPPGIKSKSRSPSDQSKVSAVDALKDKCPNVDKDDLVAYGVPKLSTFNTSKNTISAEENEKVIIDSAAEKISVSKSKAKLHEHKTLHGNHRSHSSAKDKKMKSMNKLHTISEEKKPKLDTIKQEVAFNEVKEVSVGNTSTEHVSVTNATTVTETLQEIPVIHKRSNSVSNAETKVRCSSRIKRVKSLGDDFITPKIRRVTDTATCLPTMKPVRINASHAQQAVEAVVTTEESTTRRGRVKSHDADVAKATVDVTNRQAVSAEDSNSPAAANANTIHFNDWFVKKMNPAIGKEAYQCKNCASFIVRKSGARQHIRTHDEPKFKCMRCDKLFTTRQYLSAHVRRGSCQRKTEDCITDEATNSSSQPAAPVSTVGSVSQQPTLTELNCTQNETTKEDDALSHCSDDSSKTITMEPEIQSTEYSAHSSSTDTLDDTNHTDTSHKRTAPSTLCSRSVAAGATGNRILQDTKTVTASPPPLTLPPAITSVANFALSPPSIDRKPTPAPLASHLFVLDTSNPSRIMYKCKLCASCYEKRPSLYRHFRKHHPEYLS